MFKSPIRYLIYSLGYFRVFLGILGMYGIPGIRLYPKCRVIRYPMIFKTEPGRVKRMSGSWYLLGSGYSQIVKIRVVLYLHKFIYIPTTPGRQIAVFFSYF